MAIWLLILLPFGNAMGIGLVVFSGYPQNIEINAETENESREETEIHILHSPQSTCPGKRLQHPEQAIYPTFSLPKRYVSPSTVFKNTRVIAYRSLLI